MTHALPMVELWRGNRPESLHHGHAVICDAAGQVVKAWGNPGRIIYPRSSCKMLQALPLVESGAADAAGLREHHLALACASHQGEARHVNTVAEWVGHLGLQEQDMRCGCHEPYDKTERNRLILNHEVPCQYHNNCSGKHAGFLTYNRHIRGHAAYEEITHPLQQEVRAALEELSGEAGTGYGIDGCSAPNFTTSVTGLARAMAWFAAAPETGSARQQAAYRLTRAMARHPEYVAGEGRCCTELMAAMGGKVAIKTGAEAVFVAIIPEKQLGIAVKIDDGTTRAAEAVIAALLVHVGVLAYDHPATRKRLDAVQHNCRNLETGMVRLAPGFLE